jgi:hypothetical protein
MRFSLPLLPAEFEIPDLWWEEAGMTGFTKSGVAYKSTKSEEQKLSLREIEPPFRLPEFAMDFRGFHRQRMISVLQGIARNSGLPPVRVLILPLLADISTPPFKYRILDGFHRYYASIAAGYCCLPVAMRECCT